MPAVQVAPEDTNHVRLPRVMLLKLDSSAGPEAIEMAPPLGTKDDVTALLVKSSRISRSIRAGRGAHEGPDHARRSTWAAMTRCIPPSSTHAVRPASPRCGGCSKRPAGARSCRRPDGSSKPTASKNSSSGTRPPENVTDDVQRERRLYEIRREAGAYGHCRRRDDGDFWIAHPATRRQDQWGRRPSHAQAAGVDMGGARVFFRRRHSGRLGSHRRSRASHRRRLGAGP